MHIRNLQHRPNRNHKESVRVYVCIKEREGERECMHAREREREKGRNEKERTKGRIFFFIYLLFIYSECHLTLSNNIIVHRVVVNSENLAETTFAGPGAGRFPTANSVMNDLIR